MTRLLNAQIVIATAVVLLGVWAAVQHTIIGAVLALAAGAAIGGWAARSTTAALTAQFIQRGRIVRYSEDTPLYAALLPLASLTFSPGVFLAVLYSAWVNPWMQVLLPVVFCVITSAWLMQEVVVARCLTRLGGGQPIAIDWFHARSVVGPQGMIGQPAVVDADCRPEGYVRFQGERWRARSLDGSCFVAGALVVIESVDGLVLVVRAREEQES